MLLIAYCSSWLSWIAAAVQMNQSWSRKHCECETSLCFSFLTSFSGVRDPRSAILTCPWSLLNQVSTINGVYVTVFDTVAVVVVAINTFRSFLSIRLVNGSVTSLLILQSKQFGFLSKKHNGSLKHKKGLVRYGYRFRYSCYLHVSDSKADLCLQLPLLIL